MSVPLHRGKVRILQQRCWPLLGSFGQTQLSASSKCVFAEWYQCTLCACEAVLLVSFRSLAGQPQRCDGHCVLHYARPDKQLQCGDLKGPSSQEAALVRGFLRAPNVYCDPDFQKFCFHTCFHTSPSHILTVERSVWPLFYISDRDTAQTVKERFGKKLYESLLVWVTYFDFMKPDSTTVCVCLYCFDGSSLCSSFDIQSFVVNELYFHVVFA